MKNKAENMKIKTDSKTIIVSQWDQTNISIKESHVQHHKFAYFGLEIEQNSIVVVFCLN